MSVGSIGASPREIRRSGRTVWRAGSGGWACLLGGVSRIIRESFR